MICCIIPLYTSEKELTVSDSVKPIMTKDLQVSKRYRQTYPSLNRCAEAILDILNVFNDMIHYDVLNGTGEVNQ
jgi:hypothetical protein